MSHRDLWGRAARRIVLAMAVLAACGGLTACGGGGDASLGPDGDVAIEVGAQKITNGEIERRANFLATAPQQAPDGSATAPNPPAKDSEDFRQLRLQAAEQLRDERVLGILAARCGKPCAVTSKEINVQIAQLRKEQFAGSDASLNEALTARGITRDDLRASLRAAVQEQLLSSQVQERVRYTDAEARAYYRKNIAQFRLPAEKRLSHILVATKAEAEAVRARATAENFASLAREVSTDPAAKGSGGDDLGAVSGGGLLPELAAAAKKLKANQISAPVQSQFGWHVLLLRDIKARTRSFDEVRPQLVAQQLQVKRANAVQKWRDTVVKAQQDAAKYLNAKVAPPKPAAPAPTTSTAATATTATTGRGTTATGGTTGTRPATTAAQTTSGPATP